MPAYEEAQRLHDRATRGETLSEEEQARLDAWYASQDRLEMQDLGLTAQERSITILQTQAEAALAQLRAVTLRIQQVSSENDAIRQDILLLRRQFSQQPLLHRQPA